MLLVLSDKGKGMQSSSEQPLVGEEHCVTTLITAAKETTKYRATLKLNKRKINFVPKNTKTSHSFINVIFYKFALTKG